MNTRYGGRFRPHFEITRWVSLGGEGGQVEALPPSPPPRPLQTAAQPEVPLKEVKEPSLAEDMGDEIPDFGNENAESPKASAKASTVQADKVNDADLKIFLAAAREKTNLDLGYEVGQKYARFFEHFVNGGRLDRMVFRFVDLTNGNVLRTDGWKRPNLKVRNSIQGNIYDEHKGTGLMRAGEGRLNAPANILNAG
jgi:hypothetical protein